VPTNMVFEYPSNIPARLPTCFSCGFDHSSIAKRSDVGNHPPTDGMQDEITVSPAV
jgi:hypothetical protein